LAKHHFLTATPASDLPSETGVGNLRTGWIRSCGLGGEAGDGLDVEMIVAGGLFLLALPMPGRLFFVSFTFGAGVIE
jgi:hypothetical protein